MPPDATAARVLEELPAHSMVHLSCHGSGERMILKDVAEAAASTANGPASTTLRAKESDALPAAFYLADGPLTIQRIAELTVSADLAYLSACNTATSSGRLVDEAVHLAAAMQFVGYRHVVGSLWWISDDLAPLIANAIYSRMVVNGVPDVSLSAIAVNAASRDLRDQYKSHPARWAGYIHVGP